MPNKPINLRRITLASHLILTGYGHWLPNDIRGSGSETVRKESLKILGAVHLGRKTVQPSRDELREFHRQAEPLLNHAVLWFDERMRGVIAGATEQVLREKGFTVFACAILRNHMHLVIRTHREKSESMIERITESTRKALRASQLVPGNHPVWSDRPYKVFLKRHHEVLGRIDYVNQNPQKEGLQAQAWSFVKPCVL